MTEKKPHKHEGLSECCSESNETGLLAIVSSLYWKATRMQETFLGVCVWGGGEFRFVGLYFTMTIRDTRPVTERLKQPRWSVGWFIVIQK